jgi:hypothetical protein
MSAHRDFFRSINFNPPAYAGGSNRIQANQATTAGLVSGGVAAAGDSFIPGLGTAVAAVGGGVTAGLQNADGVYKNGTAGAINDFLNPLARASNAVNGVGELFKGNFGNAAKDILGFGNSQQDDLRTALAEEQKQKRIANNQSYYGAPDASSLTATPYATGTSGITGTKPVVIEGDESVFSAPGPDGKRKLLHWNPGGPSHAEGGIPLELPHGSAIVTKQEGLGREAVEAFLQSEVFGDRSKLEKIIQDMPDDHDAPKMAAGTNGLVPPGTPRRGFSAFKPVPVRTIAPSYGFAPSASPQVDLTELQGMAGYGLNPFTPGTTGVPADVDQAIGTRGPGLPDRMREDAVKDVLNPTGRGAIGNDVLNVKRTFGDTLRDMFGDINIDPKKVGDVASGITQSAPALYNLAQGMFGDTEEVTRRHVTAPTMVAPDLTAVARSQNRAGLDAGLANAVDLSGGNAANVRANSNQAQAEYTNRAGQIESQQAGARLGVYQQNVANQAQAQQTNVQLDNQYDLQDRQTEAAKNNMLRTGLTDISNIALAKDKNAQDKATGEKIIGAMNAATPNFEFTKDEKGNFTLEPKNMSTGDYFKGKTPTDAIFRPEVAAPVVANPITPVPGSTPTAAQNTVAATGGALPPNATTQGMSAKTAAANAKLAAAAARAKMTVAPKRTLSGIVTPTKTRR